MSAACRVCAATDYSECCVPEEHTEGVIRLAQAMDRLLMGPPGHTEPHPEWYIYAAAGVVAAGVAEGDGWAVEGFPLGTDSTFTVNGVTFWFDPNAEGDWEPILESEHQRWLAEDQA